MGDLRKLIWWLFAYLFRSRAAMEAEILVLRYQLNVLRRKSPRRVVFSGFDRMVFAALYALAPSILDALQIVKPNTVIGWLRAGFRAYWRWKSRSPGWSAEDRSRNSPAHSGDEHRQFVMGRTHHTSALETIDLLGTEVSGRNGLRYDLWR